MIIHFEMNVASSAQGVAIVRQIHSLTGIVPINVTGYNPIDYKECMKPIAEVTSELNAENTRYGHLRIIHKAV